MSDNQLTTSAVETSKSAFPRTHDGYPEHAWRAWPGKVEQFVGIIRGGPASGATGGDYTDARYYVDRAVANSTPPQPLTAAVDALPGLAQTVTATNLAELPLGSHLLTAGTLVEVFVLYERTSPGDVKVYVFNQVPLRAVVVQITSAATGAGEYTGTILGGVSNATSSSNLVMPMGMTSPGSDNALILNVEESGLPGHRLMAGAYTVGVIRGATNDVPPRPIVLVRGALGSTASPTTIGSTDEGSESPETDTWAKATNATPLDLYLISRVVYNPTGDQTLYSFVRQCSFDARGELYAVSAETRITVDVTELCT